ncbi:MAG: glutamate synthase small chain [Candidatus Poribacteria bacterium]|nr:glutamate synthase small chain [Candidatus Poribacteria bacterium]
MLEKKTNMPEQPPEERACNFEEVALGYTEEQAILEATRCLQCKRPACVEGCPVGIDIPAFIAKIKEKDYKSAINIIKDKNNLPAICGRVCPQETQCEEMCIMGRKHEPVAIGRLERFASDWELKQDDTKPELSENKNGKKVAIIGSGPAGLTAAADLAKMGYDATIFEAFHIPGGVLVYGIPEFRLPKEIVKKEVEYVKNLGVKIETNVIIGKTATLDDLREEGFRAFFISTGAGLPSFLRIPGENLAGVYSANEFLTRVNLMKAYKFPEYDTPIKVGNRVAVVGGGNVAMDSARAAKRLGAEEVIIIYRRSEVEMPARHEEIEHAKEEGIKFMILTDPIEVLGDDKLRVRGVRCIKMELGEPDMKGRRRPIPVPDSEFDIEIDNLIVAIGTAPNPLITRSTPGLEAQIWGGIVTRNDMGLTSIDDVWAGGDIVSGSATVISAMGAGKKAAKAIDEYIKKQDIGKPN